MKDIHTFVILAYQESDDLEDCIKSILNQSVKSNVIVATSTKNDYIIDLASQYALGVMVNDKPSNKGGDYNYALNTFNTKLITIAHQDDIYDRNYLKEILKSYKKNKDANIIITDYYEIDNDRKIKMSSELLKKRFLVKPLKYHCFQNKKYFKMRSLKYKQSFCTSSVTFIKDKINKELFPTNLLYNNDWQGFINLAKENSKFVYIDKQLVGYRLYPKKINLIKKHEDIKIYKDLWPNWLIDYLYKEKKLKKKRINKINVFEKIKDYLKSFKKIIKNQLIKNKNQDIENEIVIKEKDNIENKEEIIVKENNSIETKKEEIIENTNNIETKKEIVTKETVNIENNKIEEKTISKRIKKQEKGQTQVKVKRKNSKEKKENNEEIKNKKTVKTKEKSTNKKKKEKRKTNN